MKVALALCARKGCREEYHDEGPLCEAHFGEVELGRALRGDFGSTEARETREAIEDGAGYGEPRFDPREVARRVARLVRIANREEGQ